MFLKKNENLIYLINKIEDPNVCLRNRIYYAKQLAIIGDVRVQTFHPIMILIPSSCYFMGSSEMDIDNSLKEFNHLYTSFELSEVREWFYKEFPKHQVKVDAFKVCKYLVTNNNFNDFQKDTGYAKKYFHFSIQICNHPVKNVTIEEAKAYCSWLSEKTNRVFRLLSEYEWEWIAKSTKNLFRFPWGNDFEIGRANTAELRIGETTAVGIFPKGVSKDGITDLAGNVEEWVDTLYSPYPPNGRLIRDRLYDFGKGCYYILRGGCFNLHGDLCLASRRHGFYPDYSITGFRIAETIK